MPMEGHMSKASKLSKKQVEEMGRLKVSLHYNREIILHGTFVAIDPSCVSMSSKPGYAIFQNGEFVEMGIVDVKYVPSLSLRLQRLHAVISESIAPHVELLVIEETPVRGIRTKANAAATGGTFMNLKSIASLKKACGAIISAFTVGTPVIDMPASLWHRAMRDAGIEVVKSDDGDARHIGLAAIQILKGN